MIWKVTAGERKVRVRYDLEWLREVMKASAASMVPFASATTGFGVKVRSYPRARTKGFTLLDEKTPDDSPSGGGRPTLFHDPVSELCKSFKGGTVDLPIPLSDVAILAKRLTVRSVKSNFKHFHVLGGADLGLDDKRSPGWPIFGYPMLCAIDRDAKIFVQKSKRGDWKARTSFPGSQGEWRVVQCVIGAELTFLLREAKLGIEVVSREGFGSVFPTLADLPDGVRLDPGLLPPDAAAKLISLALAVADDFIGEMRQKKVPVCIAQLNGYNDEPLEAVDRLMSSLLAFRAAKKSPTGAEYAVAVAAYKGSGVDVALDETNDATVVEFEFEAPLPGKGPKLRRRAKKLRLKKSEEGFKLFESATEDDPGYGSESDYEDDEVPVKEDKEVKLSTWERFQIVVGDDQKPTSLVGPLAMKKFSVVSGMAALRMAVTYGLAWANLLAKSRSGVKKDEPQEDKKDKKAVVKKTEVKKVGKREKGKLKEPLSVVKWAPYFELNLKKLQTVVDPLGGQVLVFDGAPNPINIKLKPVEVPEGVGAIVIDTTNNTSREKALYLACFQKYLVAKDEKSPGGLLIFVDSASKHPTGGDLVHGVLRVCGDRASVTSFTARSMLKHLNWEGAKDQTVLPSAETDGRRALIAARLVMRNLDFWQWIIEI